MERRGEKLMKVSVEVHLAEESTLPHKMRLVLNSVSANKWQNCKVHCSSSEINTLIKLTEFEAIFTDVPTYSRLTI